MLDIQMYHIQTVYKMVLGISRKNIRIPQPSCIIAVIRQKINSPDFVGFK